MLSLITDVLFLYSSTTGLLNLLVREMTLDIGAGPVDYNANNDQALLYDLSTSVTCLGYAVQASAWRRSTTIRSEHGVPFQLN